MLIHLIAAARPNFMKIAPLYHALSYCQMLCMALGGDPVFNNAINKLYASDYFSEALRMVQSDPSFPGTAT